MKIILTGSEMNTVRKIMEASEPGSYLMFQEQLKNNPLVKACLINDNQYEVDIDAACMTECLQAEGEFIGIIIPSLRSAYTAGKMMFEKLERIIASHKTRYYQNNIQKAQRQGEATVKDVTGLVHHLVKTTDRTKVTCFDELDLNLQDTLLHIYGDTVREMFNTILRNHS